MSDHCYVVYGDDDYGAVERWGPFEKDDAEAIVQMIRAQIHQTVGGMNVASSMRAAHRDAWVEVLNCPENIPELVAQDLGKTDWEEYWRREGEYLHEAASPAMRGIAFLDHVYPEWVDVVDLDALEMRGPWNCVLAQLYAGGPSEPGKWEDAPYFRFIRALRGVAEVDEWVRAHGFAGVGRDQEVWAEELRVRKQRKEEA